MNWIEILVIVLTAEYLLSMLALYLYRKHHHLPINPCDDAPGPKLVEAYYKAKKKEMRKAKKEGRVHGN